jgi:hypothetical protein
MPISLNILRSAERPYVLRFLAALIHELTLHGRNGSRYVLSAGIPGSIPPHRRVYAVIRSKFSEPVEFRKI